MVFVSFMKDKLTKEELFQPYEEKLVEAIAQRLNNTKGVFSIVKAPNKQESNSYTDIITNKILLSYIDIEEDIISYLGCIKIIEKLLVDAEQDKEILDKLIDKIAKTFSPTITSKKGTDGEYLVGIRKVPIKHIGRVVEKLLFQCKGDCRNLCDLARGSLVYGDEEKLKEVISFLNTCDEVLSYSTKNRFERPIKESQYRDINCAIKISNQKIVELQLHVVEIFNLNESGIKKSKEQLKAMGYNFNRNEAKAILEKTKSNNDLHEFFSTLINGNEVQLMPHYLYEFLRATRGDKSPLIKSVRNKLQSISKLIFEEAYNNYQQRIRGEVVSD